MTSLTIWLPGGHIRFFGFQTLTLVWLWILSPNFSVTILMIMERSLLIFSNVNFKTAAWQPYWIFGFRTLTLVWLWISTPNFSGTILMHMGRSLLIFREVNFKMAASHAFSSITQVCFGISVSNFMCMSFVAVGRSLVIFSYVAFKMAALQFWTMFNCNPPIAPCYPLLWCGGILVDHWSTISSWV